MKVLSGVALWRALSLTFFALILGLAFIQPLATDPDLRVEAPRVAASAALFLIPVALIPMFLRPVRIKRSRWMPIVTAAVSGGLIAVSVLLNELGRLGAASSIFRAIHVVAGDRNFGDLEIALVWRLCARNGFDVYSDMSCVRQWLGEEITGVMNYGPGWLWFPVVGVAPSWRVLVGLLMLAATSACLWFVSSRSFGRGQIALLVGSLGASWLLLLERANIDVFILWFAVLFAVFVRRSSSLAPWFLAAAAIWILGTWKYYPFALGALLLSVWRRPHGKWPALLFVGATIIYSVLARERFLAAFTGNSDQSAAYGSGLGRDSIARVMAGSLDPPMWSLGLVLLAALATIAWGYATASNSRPVSLPYAAMAFTGSSMVAIPIIVSGFGHQYKVALLVLAVPALSRLRNPTNPAVWQSSTFALIAIAAALVGLWGNPFAWSILIVVATSFALGASLRGIYLASQSRSTRDLEPMPRQHAASSSD